MPAQCVRIESITVWKSKCQGIEASGHMASAIRNSNEYIHVSPRSLSPLKQRRIQTGNGSTSVSITKVALKDYPEACLSVPSKLTVNTNPKTRP